MVHVFIVQADDVEPSGISDCANIQALGVAERLLQAILPLCKAMLKELLKGRSRTKYGTLFSGYSQLALVLDDTWTQSAGKVMAGSLAQGNQVQVFHAQ